jgi:hypothetical protein
MDLLDTEDCAVVCMFNCVFFLISLHLCVFMTFLLTGRLICRCTRNMSFVIMSMHGPRGGRPAPCTVLPECETVATIFIELWLLYRPVVPSSGRSLYLAGQIRTS